MRGISNKPFGYVLVEDRDAKQEDQTIFNIKPLKGLDGARIIKGYEEARTVGRKNKVNINQRRWKEADIDNWLAVVDSVENYHFSEDYPELFKQGWIKKIDDQETLKIIAEDISMDQYNEIIEAASSGANVSPLSESAPKSKSSMGSGA